MAKKHKKQEQRVAERNYRPAGYTNNSELARGLAKTHEQVNDTLAEGTVDYTEERDEQ